MCRYTFIDILKCFCYTVVFVHFTLLYTLIVGGSSLLEKSIFIQRCSIRQDKLGPWLFNDTRHGSPFNDNFVKPFT